MNSSSNDEVWLESDSEAISVPGKKYYEVNSLYVLVTDTPVPVHSDDSMDIDSCNGDYVDQDSDSRAGATKSAVVRLTPPQTINNFNKSKQCKLRVSPQ